MNDKIPIPLRIKNSFTSIKLIKKTQDFFIFSGKENKTKELRIIKMLAIPSYLNKEMFDLFNHLLLTRNFIKGLKEEYAPKLYEYFEIEESNMKFVVSIEKIYEEIIKYRSKEVNKYLINPDKMRIDITAILTDLHSEGKEHGDIAIRNICLDTERDKYILIDWNEGSKNSETSTLEYELESLHQILDSINDKIASGYLSSD